MTQVDSICFHCHSIIKDNKVLFSDLEFCCHGCEMVYKLLNEKNLCQYYEIDQNAGVKIQENQNSRKYDYLDREEIQSKLLRFRRDNLAHVIFNIPQIHCNSCLWLLEKLYKFNENIFHTEVHFEKKEVFIKFDISKISLKQLVQLLASIGYDPYIQLDEQKKNKSSKNRVEILKLGVTGFCFANIMMLSLPEYFSGGIIYESSIRQILPLISIALSLPVFFYSALDFFIPSYKNLKKGILIIDLPVSIAIVITFIRSLYEIYMGISNGYLDSMSGIVFFMLIGRWMQNRTQENLNFNRNYKSYFPIAIEKIKNETQQLSPIEEIYENDIIKIYSNEIIPVDAILSKGTAVIDYSFVTGETENIHVGIGEHIYAGGKQLQGAIELIVTKRHNQSHLISLWNHNAFQHQKITSNANYIDKIGIYFTWIVLAISMAAGIYWGMQHRYNLMWNAITTVLIVACPCALLLAHSFTNGHIMRILSQYKFYIRDASILNTIQQIDHIVFDKTGTLTKAEQQQIQYQGKQLNDEEKKEIADILSQSSHTLSKSIYNYLNIPIIQSTSSIKEYIGKGIEGWINNKFYKIGSDVFCQLNQDIKTHVNILLENQFIGKFQFRNVYRIGIQNLIQRLKNKYHISIISGDNAAEYNNLSTILPLGSSILFNQSPEDKLNFIEKLKEKKQSVMMVGDGLNDAGAFQASDIAIALTEKNNYFNPASDIIMDADNLGFLDKILKFIQSSKTVTKIVFIYSIVYNVIGLYFALRGVLSPVIAAILMPLSSISIILFVHLLTEFNHRKYLKNKLWKY